MNVIAFVVDFDLGPTFKIIALYKRRALWNVWDTEGKINPVSPGCISGSPSYQNDSNKMAIVNHAVQTKLSYSNSVLGE